MSKGLVTLGFLSLALTAGCRGEVGSLPDDFVTYKFDAHVAVNPTQPVPQQRVSFVLEVTSSSNREVRTDVLLKVVSSDGETAYESKWDNVLFHENEVWNLSQGFLPDSNAGKKAWAVQITVQVHETHEILFDQAVSKLDFNQ
jgi:hypothetical protein